jgi:acetyl/propionyl-CoA carboxylase alpha subunit
MFKKLVANRGYGVARWPRVPEVLDIKSFFVFSQAKADMPYLEGAEWPFYLEQSGPKARDLN